MKKPKLTPKRGPERIIQDELIKMFTLKGWFVKETHGNMYQCGFPDLYICQRRFGYRWVEVKHPTKFAFTAAQLEAFPRFQSEGVGIWILTAATETEYDKLFKAPNWYQFLPVFKNTKGCGS